MSDSVRPIDGSPPGFPSMGFSRQEYWSGLPFPSPMHESEKWKWSCSVVSDSSDPMDCSPPGSSIHGIFQAKALEWGATAFSNMLILLPIKGLEELTSDSNRPGGFFVEMLWSKDSISVKIQDYSDFLYFISLLCLILQGIHSFLSKLSTLLA